MTWQIVTQQEGSARGGRGAPARGLGNRRAPAASLRVRDSSSRWACGLASGARCVPQAARRGAHAMAARSGIVDLTHSESGIVDLTHSDSDDGAVASALPPPAAGAPTGRKRRQREAKSQQVRRATAACRTMFTRCSRKSGTRARRHARTSRMRAARGAKTGAQARRRSERLQQPGADLLRPHVLACRRRLRSSTSSTTTICRRLVRGAYATARSMRRGTARARS